MVQSRPGFSVRLHHRIPEDKIVKTPASRTQRRTTHAANAQLWIDADVADQGLAHAWLEEDPNLTAKATRSSMILGTKPLKRTPIGSEVQMARLEVCSAAYAQFCCDVSHVDRKLLSRYDIFWCISLALKMYPALIHSVRIKIVRI